MMFLDFKFNDAVTGMYYQQNNDFFCFKFETNI